MTAVGGRAPPGQNMPTSCARSRSLAAALASRAPGPSASRPSGRLGRNTGAAAAVHLRLLDPLLQRRRGTADLRGYRQDRQPPRCGHSLVRPMRTARSRTSGKYLPVVLLMMLHPTRELEPKTKAGRFRASPARRRRCCFGRLPVESYRKQRKNVRPGDKDVRSYIQATNEDIPVSYNPSSDYDCLEKQDASGSASGKADLVASLTPRRIYALAPEDRRIRIDLRKGDRFVPTWRDIEMAAHDLRPDLGIGPEGWTYAIQTMVDRWRHSPLFWQMPDASIPRIPCETPAATCAA